MTNPVIYWFRNDLRLHDNPALLQAIETGKPVVPVYILDDSLLSQHPLGFNRMGEHRKNFLFETLLNLSESIHQAGNRLWIYKGKTSAILRNIYNQINAEAIFTQSEYASEEIVIEQELKPTVNLRLIDGSMLFTPSMVPFSPMQSPFYYTAFKNKVWELGQLVRPVATVTQIPSLNKQAQFMPKELFVPTNTNAQLIFKGGETEGLKRLDDYFSTNAPLHYSETRNALHGKDFSSWLAPWLANGALSVRLVWQRLNQLIPVSDVEIESVKTLKEQLIWRDYFRYLMMRYGNRLFWLKGLRSSEPSMYNDRDAFEKWRLGQTGQPIVDALMCELFHTGFMSNRGRMLVSYYLAKELKVNWQWGAAWFESMLIDYDVYSNYGNWAYQSGRGTDSRINRRFNLTKQAEKFDADGSFRKKWRQETEDGKPDIEYRRMKTGG